MQSTNIKKTNLKKWLARKKKTVKAPGIPKMPENTPIPLSRGQQRLWLLQQLYPDNPFYQYAHSYRFKGALNVALLLESFQVVAQRHTILRTNFREENNQLIQHIQEDTTIPTEVIDLQHLTKEEQNQAIQSIRHETTQKTFDLSQDVLVRLTVLVLEEKEHLILLSIHHIIGDRWSLQVLNKEWATAYQTLSQRNNTNTTPLEIQYADYAHWQQSQAEKPQDLAYWMENLAGELPVLALPTDKPRPVRPTFQGLTTTKAFSGELSKQIKDLSKSHNVTPYAFLLAAYQILLYRYSGQDDIIIGTPFTNRDKVALEKLIGFFNETLVLRANLSDDPTFVDLIAQVKKNTTKAFLHKNTPFDTLVKALKPARNGTANPLFQVMFLYNTFHETPSFGEGLVVEEKIVDLGVSKFDLTLFVTDTGKNLTATFEYATDLFRAETIERMHQHLDMLLKSIVQNPLQKISTFPILVEKEKQKILVDWNKTAIEIPTNISILSLFEEQVTANPDTVCVVFEKKQLTYQQVNERANAIAYSLCSKGVTTNMPVGLYTKRSVDMLVGIVAILKAGGAYVPLDPEYPAERIEYMLEDAAVRVVLTQTDLQEDLAKNRGEALTFDTAISIGKNKKYKPIQAHRQDLAYIIYTSGSTGKPKGVPITHGNLIHSTTARFHFYKKQPTAFLLMSSFSFDSSVVGLFWTLISGGTLIIPKKRIEQDIHGLANLIAKHNISHTLMLPSLYDLLLTHAPKEKLQSLDTIMVAGEACTSTVINRHFKTLPTAKLYNEYGPTEATVWCTAHEIKPSDVNGLIPIGRPIPNVQNYILDQHQQPVPIGVAGELCIGGAGLSPGYWQRAALTEEKFIEVSFYKNQHTRLYRTGDLARYRNDGVIEFLGRVDQQVKIRGYRIELDEIKAVLQQQKGIREAVVTVQAESHQQRLLAYITREKNFDKNNLKTDLKAQLPNYMVPSVIVELDEFPRLPNGKINRKALPKPNENDVIQQGTYEVPQTKLEKQLTEIWEEALNIRPIGRLDNFFEIGGDSILSIQIIAKSRDANLSLTANQLFETQTIAALAAAIESTNHSTDKSISIHDLPKLEQDFYPLSFMQQAFLMHHLQGGEDQGFLQLEFSLKGNINKKLWEVAWQQTVQRHAVLRTSMEWGGIEQPIQRIHETNKLNWQYLDWSDLSTTQQTEKLTVFRAEDKSQALDLAAVPMMRLTLIELAENKSLLFWTCHHILVDGWSGGIILKDVLAFYQSAQENRPLASMPLPTYADFLHWKEQQDKTEAEAFWKATFADFKALTLFEVDSNSTHHTLFKTHSFTISEMTTLALQNTAKEYRVTLNTLLKGAWSFLLGQYFDEQEVVFGTTVSGRFSDFPNMEEVTGLFMNVLPTRIKWTSDIALGDWLKEIQTQSMAANTFDQSNLEEITAWINHPKHIPLFDSLFVFGNFLKDGLAVGDIAIEDFHGGFTSTYPLTIRVNPVAALGFDIRYNVQKISEETVQWFASQLVVVLDGLTKLRLLNFKSLVNIVSPFEGQVLDNSTVVDTLNTPDEEAYLAPRNASELHLTKIWEGLFGYSPIGVTDNFFEIGGKSLLAMQLFSKIEDELGKVLPPMTLMQHPTIESLAKLIQDETTTAAWTTIVPLRASGSKTPLFCIHAGGAHVFFYSGLTKYLSAEQPVYAIQPQGLDGVEDYHLSIEEMATHYISEIRKVQLEGPYRLLGTCFSNAVCLEMAIQLEAQGLEVSLFIVDSAPAHLIPLEKSKPIQRFFRILKDQNWSVLYRKLRRRFFIIKKQVIVKKESEAQLQLQKTIRSLNRVYAAYTWKSFGGKVTLIRSKQFAEKEGKIFHLTQWKALAKGGLEVHVVDGQHLTIFEEPAVKGLAEQLEQCLDAEILAV